MSPQGPFSKFFPTNAAMPTFGFPTMPSPTTEMNFPFTDMGNANDDWNSGSPPPTSTSDTSILPIRSSNGPSENTPLDNQDSPSSPTSKTTSTSQDKSELFSDTSSFSETALPSNSTTAPKSTVLRSANSLSATAAIEAITVTESNGSTVTMSAPSTSPTETESTARHTSNVGMILGIVAGLASVIVIVLLVFLYRRRIRSRIPSEAILIDEPEPLSAQNVYLYRNEKVLELRAGINDDAASRISNVGEERVDFPGVGPLSEPVGHDTSETDEPPPPRYDEAVS